MQGDWSADVCSAEPGQEDSPAITRAFEAGATDFISKPVNWALLPRRLEYILRNAAAAERIERLAYFDPLTGLPNRQYCIETDRKSTRLNSSHLVISYAVFCLKKKKKKIMTHHLS